MSLSNTTENATLQMHLQGADPSYRAGATQYLALFTGDPGETASLGAEAGLTGAATWTLAAAAAMLPADDDPPARRRRRASPSAARCCPTRSAAWSAARSPAPKN